MASAWGSIVSGIAPRKLMQRLRYFRQLVYREHVEIEFPVATLADELCRPPALPQGYALRSYAGEGDLEPWARLLNEDGGFGTWTPQRVRKELVDNLIHPEAALFALHCGEIVGCGCFVDASRRGRRIGRGTFWYIRREHRGRGRLSLAMLLAALATGVKAGYHSLFAVTDPTRLSALAIYLSIGSVPRKNSLYSHVQWRRIERRLKPTVKAMECRRRRRPSS